MIVYLSWPIKKKKKMGQLESSLLPYSIKYLEGKYEAS
jgi:p-aminobenzoyl-glutamate transporter AbgT